jgi:hypothetical protein
VADRPLSNAEQRLLDTIYEPFRSTGLFPIYQWVDKKLDANGINVEKTLQGLPRGLVLDVGGDPARSPGIELRLYVRGLRECTEAEPDLDRFLELLRYLVRREQDFRPPSTSKAVPLQVTDEDVRRDLRLAEIDVAKAWSILRLEPGLSFSGGGSAEEWSFEVTSAIRRFRDVKDIDDYLARQSNPEGGPALRQVREVAGGMPIDRIDR